MQSSYRLICGDAKKSLEKIESNTVQTVITSPPYYNMRDYGFSEQIGLESSPEAYIQKLVEVFSEVKRTLRDDGTLWINIGDSYCDKSSAKLKKKDLIGIPWMLAFALRADGWYLRSDVIWSKPNPLPGGSSDKPISSHEYMFLLSKSEDYYYDAEATKETAVETNEDGSFKKRLKRDVWIVPVASFKGAHFAVFPTKLIEPCIAACSSNYGCCDKCKKPYKRLVEKNRYATRPGKKNKIDKKGFANRDSGRHLTETKTLGWEKNCSCDSTGLDKCTVMDIFCGSGTTGVVAMQNNAKFIGIDGQKEYIEIARTRLEEEQAKTIEGM